MTPPHAHTWGRRGHTPVVRVRDRSRRRISVAALACYKPGESPRLIYRPRFHLPLKGARKSFAWTDYRDLLVRAHIQLGAPIVVIWDNLNTHRAADLRQYVADHDWLTVFQLPSCAPDLNPVEGIWSLLRRSHVANVAFEDSDLSQPHSPPRPRLHPTTATPDRRLPHRDRTHDHRPRIDIAPKRSVLRRTQLERQGPGAVRPTGRDFGLPRNVPCAGDATTSYRGCVAPRSVPPWHPTPPRTGQPHPVHTLN
ncbi:transposase [Streptomyces silvisoli]